MQVADPGADLGDALALEGEDQPEHAVRRGMLRTHVDDQALAARRVARVGGGDDLVPVLPGDGVDAALLGFAGHAYALRSSGGGIVAPRYSTGMPPSG